VVLGALDDKIELNRRMNATLEAMARALFQSWFVDFLPVRANMDAKADDSASGLPPAEPSSWFVYAMECGDGSIYIGQTEDLRQRWLQHIGGRGGRWTKGHTPTRVAYWETQSSREAAVEREKWLKTGFGRKWLKKEIAARTQTGDPVRAKLDGHQPPGLDEALAALFPNEFEDSELGHIPKGWEIRSLDKIAHYLNGLALQKYPPGDGRTLPVIKIAQLRKGDSVGADRCNTKLPADYIVQDADVLFSWSGSLEVELWCGGPGALNQHLFKVTSSEFPKWFYYFWTLYHLDEFRLIAAGKATTMGHIQRGHLTAVKVLIPSRALLDAMTRTMSPLVEQLIANRIQSRTLASLRDALLPKLLNGDISATRQPTFS
jgi:type I restriction enzyme S subunit